MNGGYFLSLIVELGDAEHGDPGGERRSLLSSELQVP